MALAGKSGKLEIGTSVVSEINNWSLDIGTDTLEVTALGDDWKEFIAGLKEWSASSEGTFNIPADNTGQKAVQDAFLNGDMVTVKLYVNATNYYSGSAYISSLNVEDPVDDAVTISFEFQGTGALAYN